MAAWTKIIMIHHKTTQNSDNLFFFFREIFHKIIYLYFNYYQKYWFKIFSLWTFKNEIYSLLYTTLVKISSRTDKQILTFTLLNKLSSAWIVVCLNCRLLHFKFLSIYLKFGRHIGWVANSLEPGVLGWLPRVCQLWTWPDAELLGGVWSGSKLFAKT